MAQKNKKNETKNTFTPMQKKELQKTNNKKKSKGSAVPKTAQATIPYHAAYLNGIIETDPGTFSKSYFIEDINFKIATEEEQLNIFTRFGDLLNMFGNEVRLQITLFNRNMDKEKFQKKVLLPMKGDGLDQYRKESNDILLHHMSQSHNNLTHERYLTVSIDAENIDEATVQFARLDTEITNAIKKINDCETHPMTINERLSVLYDIFNHDNSHYLSSSGIIDGKKVSAFDLNNIAKQGLTTKDIICPSQFSFDMDHYTIGNKYARSLFLENLPAYLSTNFMSDLNSIPSNILISTHFESIRQDKAVRLIKNQIVNINANVIDAQKRATKAGYSAELISPDLQKAQEEAMSLLEDMTSRNQKMFFLSMAITVFADSKEDLNRITQSVLVTAQKHLCSIKKLSYQQEQGMATSLPLGINKLAIKRLLPTEAASLFLPFSSQELAQENGIYYGLNAISKNLILFDRTASKNSNGIILGTSGSGKSFSAKREIFNVFLSSDADVFIIDPEREYAPMAEMLGGEVIRIAAGSNTYINPLDMDIFYADDDDPVTLKSDFICSLCETVIGGHQGLQPVEKSVIDRCVRQIYIPYMEYMRTAPPGVTCDKERAPTLMDFYELLLTQPEPEAQNIALALEYYVTGSLDTFAHRSNVNTSSRFVVYDIKDIGAGMKEMGIQICLNDIWNKTIDNKLRYNKRTWSYIDEFYLLTQSDSSAKFLQQIFKRARKWKGVVTGITQDVEDMLASREVRGIINNCDFIMMLNQSPLARIELGNMFNMSAEQLQHITNTDAGEGLLYTGKSLIPFIDKYPTNTKSFQVMSTSGDALTNQKK